jgi:hypothetical protein
MRVMMRDSGGWVLIAVAFLGIAGLARPAAAQRVLFQADGALNVGYNQTTRPVYVGDPNAEQRDIRDSSIAGLFTEISPGISLQTGSPRVSWRIGYKFAANLRFADTSSTSTMGQPAPEDAPPMEGAAAADKDRQAFGYANSADVALAAQLTQFTTLTLTGAIAQGATAFLQSQRRPEMGNPEVRAPGNPSMITMSLAEALAWEVGRQWNLLQSLRGNLSAQQDDFAKRSSDVAGTLALERVWVRDTAGVELRAGVSWLRPLLKNVRPYNAVNNALLARWNHDFTWRWTAALSAGVEQVYTGTGSKPLAFLPSGGANASYTIGDVVTALAFTHGTQTNLQVGSISVADQLTARGVISIDADKLRVLSFSGGILHNEPLGEVASVVSAGTGNALQGDVGFTTAITKGLVATARYSLAYQFDQAGELGSTLAHVFLIGVTASYNNLEPDRRQMPGRGLRVDHGDVEGFPVVEP